MFGKQICGFAGGQAQTPRSVVTCPLDKDMGGKSKQFHVLLDEIIDPKVTISGGQYSTNGMYSTILKLKLDAPVAFEVRPLLISSSPTSSTVLTPFMMMAVSKSLLGTIMMSLPLCQWASTIKRFPLMVKPSECGEIQS